MRPGIAATDDNAYNDGMAVLNIRRLPDEVYARLRVRAARAGRSMEAEAREILTAACLGDAPMTPDDVQTWVSRLYRGRPPKDGSASLLADRRRDARRG